jgi:hypothetical protein
MRKPTNMMLAGLAGTGLLLAACEIPPGGPPPVIVLPDPGGDTPFSGFPATFKGTNVIEEDGESNQGITGWYDQFVTTVDEETSLVITCEVYDEGTAVYIDWDAADDFMVCAEDGPVLEVTVDSGDLEIEIGNYASEVGSLHPYVIRVDVAD